MAELPHTRVRELFVYYRVSALQAGAARRVVLAFQAELMARHPGLKARLLRRPGEIDAAQTWMETYAADALSGAAASPARASVCTGTGSSSSGGSGGITATIQADIESSARALTPFLQGPRHAEVFVA